MSLQTIGVQIGWVKGICSIEKDAQDLPSMATGKNLRRDYPSLSEMNTTDRLGPTQAPASDLKLSDPDVVWRAILDIRRGKDVPAEWRSALPLDPEARFLCDLYLPLCAAAADRCYAAAHLGQ